MRNNYIKLSYKEVKWIMSILNKFWLKKDTREIMRLLASKLHNDNMIRAIAFFLAGAIIAVMSNFTANHHPSPQYTEAATTPTPTKTPTPSPTPTPTPTPSYSITGHIFIDNNANGTDSSQDSNYTNGATISASLNNTPISSVISTNTGKFTISGLQNGTYSVLLAIPDGYRTTTDNPISVILTNGNATGIKFGIVPNLWNIPSSEKFVMCHDLHQFVKDHCN